jgi:processive 1,2-diacylglycerol beta-glucosyltransferase
MSILDHLPRWATGYPGLYAQGSNERYQYNGRESPTNPRILLLSASVGSGHMRAAEAIRLALLRLCPQARVHAVDVLSMATIPFRYCYAQGYLEFIRHAPLFLSYIYNCMDRPDRMGHPYWYELRVWLEKKNLLPFVELLHAEPWDLVINTFFLPAEIVANLRRRREFHAPQVMVITDFEAHRNWIAQPCDHYFTATEEAARYLQYFGIPAAATSVTGIPILPAFAEPKEREACLARQGLRGDRPIVLFVAGWHSPQSVEETFRALLEVPLPLEIVAIMGHNKDAQRRVTGVRPPRRHHIKILGYTDQMDELLAVADLVMTKPGGLTVSEALARGVGLAIVNPIPGQEERNSDFLLEQGAAIKINHLPTLAYKVTELLSDPRRLAWMKAQARRLGKPRAALDIAERSLALVGRPVMAAK